MALDDPILTISVTGKLLGLHPRTIMLYERVGLLKPHRTDTKRRMFSMNDLDDLQFIKHLTQNKGINLVGVRALLEAITVAKRNGLDLKKELFPEFKTSQLI